MQQMQGQPLAFANPYGAGFTGGYNPRLYDRPPVVAPTPSPDTSGLIGGGDSGADYSLSPSQTSNLEYGNPLAMISAGRSLSGYGGKLGGVLPGGLLANLLGMISTGIGERALSQTLANQDLELGQAMNAMANANAMQSMQNALAADVAAANQAAANANAMQSMQDALAADIAAANAAADMGGLLGMSDASVGLGEAAAIADAIGASGFGDYGGFGGYGGDMGGYGGDGGGYGGDSGGGGSDSGGGDSGGGGSDGAGADSGGDSAGWAKGGKVTTNGLLTHVDPPGPDEGYGALQVGEYVIKKSTAKKLGDKKLNALNQGRATIKMRK
jgi:hypothetical protein